MVLQVSEPVDNVLAISAVRRLCAAIGFPETEQFLIATVVSELATNIIHYAGRGEILLTRVQDGAKCGIEVLARDNGPGIADLELAMADNYSTGGTLGLGLPSVKRIMDEFSLESAPGQGVRCLCRKWKE